MTRRKRRRFSADEKLSAVRRHLMDKVPISDLCDELGLQPTQIYQWQKQLFDHGGGAFDKPGQTAKQDDAKDREIQTLKSKIQTKNEVVAELLEEHVQLKKELGEP
jgi:transposase